MKVPVSGTAPFVGALQMAIPFVASLALLIVMAAGSGLDQAPYTRAIHCGTAHPAGAVGAAIATN